MFTKKAELKISSEKSLSSAFTGQNMSSLTSSATVVPNGPHC